MLCCSHFYEHTLIYLYAISCIYIFITVSLLHTWFIKTIVYIYIPICILNQETESSTLETIKPFCFFNIDILRIVAFWKKKFSVNETEISNSIFSLILVFFMTFLERILHIEVFLKCWIELMQKKSYSLLFSQNKCSRKKRVSIVWLSCINLHNKTQTNILNIP